MKLRNWLPTKYLTEENPVIGLSFEVGYARIAVIVGQTIIHTMSNMIRGDVDSQILLCIPSYMYRHGVPGLRDSGGGLRREDPNILKIHSVLTPRYRSRMQYPELECYRDFDSYSAQLLELRRNHKAANPHPDIVEMDRLQRLVNSPYLYQNVGTVGHVDHRPVTSPGYMTQAMYDKELRRAAVEAGFGEMDYMARKLLVNGRSGVPSQKSGHSSLTALCSTGLYALTDTSRGASFNPISASTWAQLEGCKTAVKGLVNNFHFTGQGMIPKDL